MNLLKERSDDTAHRQNQSNLHNEREEVEHQRNS
jgi:hypothetical protein